MADNELQSLSFANSANKVDSPQIKAQKDTGKELEIKPPEINIQSAQQIVDGVSITPQEGVARMEIARNDLEQALQSLNTATNLNFSVDEASNRFVVKVTEPNSGSIIFEVPSEAILRVAKNIEVMKGIIFDKKA
ncbi:MAG: flagellar protein FlaG [Pseudomonadota bacterium]|nr:flagellar protein FlaG [Pseudomonadota bacterium]